LINGKCVEEVFQIFELMDQLLAREFTRLRPEAIEKHVSLRSDMFHEADLGIWQTTTSAPIILKNFNSGG